MQTSLQKNEHFMALEWLRFFLGLYIIIFHTFHYANSPNFIRDIFGFGFFATSTFFILSGFLLSHVYLKHHGTNSVILRESSRSFIVKRFSNLYPIHIFSMFLYIGIIMVIPYFGINENDANATIRFVVFDSNNGTPHEELRHYMSNTELFLAFIMNIFMVQSWNPYYMMFNFPTWSISTLFFFYLIFPFVVLKINKIKNIYLFLLILNFIYILPVVFVILFTNIGAPESGLLHRNPLIRLPEFLAGIVLCVIYHRSKINNTLPNKKDMFILLSFIILGLYLSKLFLKILSNDFNSGNIAYHLLHNGLILTLEMAIIYYFVNIPYFKNEKLIEIAKKFGGAALPMFALHIPLYAIFIRVQKYLNEGQADYLYYIVYLVITIYLCIIFQEKFVVKARNKIQKILEK